MFFPLWNKCMCKSVKTSGWLEVLSNTSHTSSSFLDCFDIVLINIMNKYEVI